MLSRHVITVGGRDFGLSETNYNKIKHAVAPGTSSCPIIDRDPQIFADYIWPYLIGYTIYLKETKKETLWRIWSDAQYYQLPGLAELVQAELGPSITMTPEQKEEAIQEETKVIKQTFTSFATLLGASFGHKLGMADLGQKIIAELEEFDEQIRECAIETVENGGDFFNLNSKQKLIMAVGTSIYFKLFSAVNEERANVLARPPPDAFMDEGEIGGGEGPFPWAQGVHIQPVNLNYAGFIQVPLPLIPEEPGGRTQEVAEEPGGRAQEVAEELEEHLENIIIPGDPGNVETTDVSIDISGDDMLNYVPDSVKIIEPKIFTDVHVEDIIVPDLDSVKVIEPKVFAVNIDTDIVIPKTVEVTQQITYTHHC